MPGLKNTSKGGCPFASLNGNTREASYVRKSRLVFKSIGSVLPLPTARVRWSLSFMFDLCNWLSYGYFRRWETSMAQKLSSLGTCYARDAYVVVAQVTCLQPRRDHRVNGAHGSAKDERRPSFTYPWTPKHIVMPDYLAGFPSTHTMEPPTFGAHSKRDILVPYAKGT